MAKEEYIRLRSQRDAAIQQVTKLQNEIDRLRLGLKDFEEYGVRADLFPTNSQEWDVNQWFHYIQRMDSSVRSRAKLILDWKDENKDNRKSTSKEADQTDDEGKGLHKQQLNAS